MSFDLIKSTVSSAEKLSELYVYNTLYPSEANLIEMPLPIPRPPPVITASGGVESMGCPRFASILPSIEPMH